jgi:7-cyano-7-deazaguanine reductase
MAEFLGKVFNKPIEELSLIEWSGGDIEVCLHCSEFTSHCPVTEQPDFGSLKIVYEPDKSLVETKSMKLFLWGFREKKGFNERLVASIADNFFDQVKPKRVTVMGQFHPRGGIAIEVKAIRKRDFEL